ncbi:MAG: hypothetical protein QM710_15165 [Flavobacterium sp.]
MSKTLLSPSENQKYLYMVLLCALFSFQKAAATTYYINDNDLKGDIYTTALGNDSNEGTASSPKLTIHATYEKAQDGDTIIIDTGSYPDLSAKGELLFPVTKKITFIIAGVTDTVFLKTPLPTNIKVNPAEIYIDKDQPIEREAYLKKRKSESKKSQ